MEVEIPDSDAMPLLTDFALWLTKFSTDEIAEIENIGTPKLRQRFCLPTLVAPR